MVSSEKKIICYIFFYLLLKNIAIMCNTLNNQVFVSYLGAFRMLETRKITINKRGWAT